VSVSDADAARAFGLVAGEVVIAIHCGSRGLGHQVGTEFLRDMAIDDTRIGLRLPDRELACSPIDSELGRRYLGAMRAAINCAFANRQIIGHLLRQALSGVLPGATADLLFDVSHNTCKVESHLIDGERRSLFVHRKGATRAFGPGHPTLPEALREAGQPVFVGGSMGTASWILAGTAASEGRAFSSACHGAGRSMSRHQARKNWRGADVVEMLARRGTVIRSPSLRGVAEEAPGAYKDVTTVIEATHEAGLARKVAELRPVACIKG
jgi:tRNA-splicing ligase RtcB